MMKRKLSLSMKRAVVLMMCAMLLAGCGKDDEVTDASVVESTEETESTGETKENRRVIDSDDERKERSTGHWSVGGVCDSLFPCKGRGAGSFGESP